MEEIINHKVVNRKSRNADELLKGEASEFASLKGPFDARARDSSILFAQHHRIFLWINFTFYDLLKNPKKKDLPEYIKMETQFSTAIRDIRKAMVEIVPVDIEEYPQDLHDFYHLWHLQAWSMDPGVQMIDEINKSKMDDSNAMVTALSSISEDPKTAYFYLKKIFKLYEVYKRLQENKGKILLYGISSNFSFNINGGERYIDLLGEIHVVNFLDIPANCAHHIELVETLMSHYINNNKKVVFLLEAEFVSVNDDPQTWDLSDRFNWIIGERMKNVKNWQGTPLSDYFMFYFPGIIKSWFGKNYAKLNQKLSSVSILNNSDKIIFHCVDLRRLLQERHKNWSKIDFYSNPLIFFDKDQWYEFIQKKDILDDKTNSDDTKKMLGGGELDRLFYSAKYPGKTIYYELFMILQEKNLVNDKVIDLLNDLPAENLESNAWIMDHVFMLYFIYYYHLEKDLSIIFHGGAGHTIAYNKFVKSYLNLINESKVENFEVMVENLEDQTGRTCMAPSPLSVISFANDHIKTILSKKQKLWKYNTTDFIGAANTFKWNLLDRVCSKNDDKFLHRWIFLQNPPRYKLDYFVREEKKGGSGDAQEQVMVSQYEEIGEKIRKFDTINLFGNATPEEVVAFYKAINIPVSGENMYDDLNVPNLTGGGAVPWRFFLFAALIISVLLAIWVAILGPPAQAISAFYPDEFKIA